MCHVVLKDTSYFSTINAAAYESGYVYAIYFLRRSWSVSDDILMSDACMHWITHHEAAFVLIFIFKSVFNLFYNNYL